MTTEVQDDHARNSVLREIILEHFFIGEVLKRLWQKRIFDVEVLRSEFDAGGYDLVLSRGDLVRHIQLKSRLKSSATRSVSAGLRLADRPSGCIVWMVVDEELEFDHFLFFGGAAGEPLPDLLNFKITRHVKANRLGEFLERPAHRLVPASKFQKLDSMDQLIWTLLGEFQT